MSFWKWSRTASANATADGSINWAEGMAPSAVNDSARAMMAAAAKFRDDVSGTLTTGGTATAYTVTTNQTFDTLAHLDKAILTIVPHATSGASPTLNVDGLGAKAVNVSTGVAVPTGALVQGTPYEVVYFNATAEFIVINGTPVLVTSASNLSANVVTTPKVLDGNVTYAKIQNVAHGKVLARLSAGAGVVEEAVIPFGQCRLAKSGSNLVLSPFKGNLITVNSLAEPIPDAGVTLSTGGLSATTLYYIYAWMNSGTMALEASTTAYAAQVGTGVTVKAGDATRTLVGMARTDGTTAWTDAATQRFVRSWFNDPGISLLNGFTANRAISNTSWTEVSSEIRIEFVVWTGEVVQVEANGVTINNTVNDGATSSIGFDGTTPEDTSAFGGLVTAGGFPGNIYAPFAACVFKSSLSEGYHYATLLGAALGGGSATWLGSASNATPSAPRCTLRGILKL